MVYNGAMSGIYSFVGEMSSSPLEQFEIFSLVELPELFGFRIDFTNSSLYMVISILLSFAILGGGWVKNNGVPKYWQALSELVYEFVEKMLLGIAGPEAGKYLPLVLTSFVFILSCNIAGMLPLPMNFTVTSHIAVTFALSLSIFSYYNFIAIKKKKLGYFRLFLPSGTPWWLAPMMIVVEVFAYFSRPVSLSVRLTANMVAGHTILKVISGFVISASSVIAIFPFILVVLLIAFEIFIAILQAYIFATLMCVYLSDVLDSH